MEIPAPLVSQINEGKVILFLGAGASIGAKSKNGAFAPVGQELARLLADRFLDGKERERPLNIVAEYAISINDLIPVQSYIKELFEELDPASFHELIPTFRWGAIFTTNYDLVVEKAYVSCKNKAQGIVPTVKNTDNFDHLIRTTDTIPYIKLHGCINHSEDESIPMILTIDQYVDHLKNRHLLFNRIEDLGLEYTFVFIGHGLEDPDIRHALLKLGDNFDKRPRFYSVTPDVTDMDKALWEKKKITTLKGTFEEFLTELDGKIDKELRKFSREKHQHEVEGRFVTGLSLSSEVVSFLEADLTYVRPNLPTQNYSAQDFYKGVSSGWDAIQKNYDSSRILTDNILSDVILIEESERSNISDFYLVKGHAGSGKSILLKRLAWDAAIDYQKLCLFWDSNSKIDSSSIFEIVDNCGERVFLFVDRCSYHVGDILYLIRRAVSHNAKLTIIANERSNEWNMDCEPLHNRLTGDFNLPYLKEKEIGLLLDKLSQNNSLGLIEGKSREDQELAFREKAGRQLLVALYEVTMGKSFEDIIVDEYKNIEPDLAKLIYRTVCTLNRLDIPVRSGIIHRIFGISFNDFKKDFFKPLENIVLTSHGDRFSDHSYRARHPLIAEKIFERSIPNPSNRLDLYLKIIDALDIGYSADTKAYKELLKARNLMQVFSDPSMVRRLYKEAEPLGLSDDYYHQQLAIYEMKGPNPNYNKAENHLDIAEKLAPYNPTINHSRSELELLRAESSHDLERARHLSKAREIASKNIGTNSSTTSHGFHTLCKVALTKLKEELARGKDVSDVVVEEHIKEFEGALNRGLQEFPESEFLLDIDAQFANLVRDEGRAIESLERSFKANSGSPYVAVSLARMYYKMGDVSKSKATLETVLDIVPADKICNGYMAFLIEKSSTEEGELAEYYWRRSFTEGDSNYDNQFWYARALYTNGKYEPANQCFSKLRRLNIDPKVKNKVRGIVCDKDRGKVTFRGSISRKESTYAFVSNPLYGGRHFLFQKNIDSSVWESLRNGQSISYSLGFTFGGPSCIDVEIES